MRPARAGGDRAGTHPFGLLIGEDARGPSGREVAVDFEGVPGAALVRVHPVFTWREGGRCVRAGPGRFQEQPRRLRSAVTAGPVWGLSDGTLLLTPPSQRGNHMLTRCHLSVGYYCQERD